MKLSKWNSKAAILCLSILSVGLIVALILVCNQNPKASEVYIPSTDGNENQNSFPLYRFQIENGKATLNQSDFMVINMNVDSKPYWLFYHSSEQGNEQNDIEFHNSLATCKVWFDNLNSCMLENVQKHRELIGIFSYRNFYYLLTQDSRGKYVFPCNEENSLQSSDGITYDEFVNRAVAKYEKMKDISGGNGL